MSFNETLDLKLDNLDLNEKYKEIPRPSLLSTSLANQKQAQVQAQLQTQTQTQTQSQTQTQITHQESQYDHPEPELLATSVGKDSNGQLIPSSSNISLFLLNQSQQYQSPQPQYYFHSNLSSYVPGQTPDDKHKPKRHNSYNSLNQRRFESYRLTSPPIHSSKSPSPVIPQEHFSSMIASIPINAKNIAIPDSPNLDPTSLTNSPSRFWLSSQTPPKSINNSYKRLPVLPEQAIYDPRLEPVTKSNVSPILNPVQTPNGDPMTPLYLNSDVTNYFGFPDNKAAVDAKSINPDTFNSDL